MNYIDTSSRRKFTAKDNYSESPQNDDTPEIKPYMSQKKRSISSIPPPPPAEEYDTNETHAFDDGFIPPPPPAEDEETKALDNSGAEKELTTAERIRLKLAGKPVPETATNTGARGGERQDRVKKEAYRDPKIMAKLVQPVIVSSKIGQGISMEEAKDALEQQKRKLMKWKYHMAVRASEVQKSKRDSATSHKDSRNARK